MRSRLLLLSALILAIITLASASPIVRRQLPISTNGSCGAAAGFRCASGYCCSSGGFCGTGTAWCGAGCQPAYGICSSSSNTTTTVPAGAKTLTTTKAAAVKTSTTKPVAAKTTTVAPAAKTTTAAVPKPTTTAQVAPAKSTTATQAPSTTVPGSSPTTAIPMPTNVTPVRQWLTQDLFERLFPYAKASQIYTNDGQPFYTLSSLLDAIDYLNSHSDSALHGFGTTSNNQTINILEVAAFLASAVQETGDPSLTIPYPWSYPAPEPRSGPEFSAGGGGLLFITEGLSSSIVPIDSVDSPSPLNGLINMKLALNDHEKYLMAFQQTALAVSILDVKNANQTNFGLGAGTGAGVVFQPGLTAVSDDGTLYGDQPLAEADKVKPSSMAATGASNDRTKACQGPYCQYGGRGLQQLSYNFNYAPCSIDLFGDYRLVRYPNLITSVDRTNFLGLPGVFGFPGPNPNGNNQLPADIASSTPPARQMAWITSLWFYMKATSGRDNTCHQAMMDPFKYGITAANIVVNSQGGCDGTSWAAQKVSYYRRAGAVIGLDANTLDKSIVCPPAIW